MQLQHDWIPIWLIPNVTLASSIVRTPMGLLTCGDARITAKAKQYPNFYKLLRAFKDEFGVRIWPTVIAVQSGNDKVKNIDTIQNFKNAVCISAITHSHARRLSWRRSGGIEFSDSFDVYPWMIGKEYDEHIFAFTPGISGLHDVNKLRGSSAAALPTRQLGVADLDEDLLSSLLDQWESSLLGDPDAETVRLFRAIEMACSAARMPGGADANHYDAGRRIANWVSAFEILTHDGRSNFEKVLALLLSIEWKNPELRGLDKEISYKGKLVKVNTAGFVYKKLYDTRNDYLHGNPVTWESLTIARGRSILPFAACLFSMALRKKINGDRPSLPSEIETVQRISDKTLSFSPKYRAQRTIEDAIALADKPLE